MCDSFLICFDKFQTFIVGILGFGGVIFTIYMNACLSRVQHERQIGHERESLRTALCSELTLIKNIFCNRCEQTDEDDQQSSAFYPVHISTEVKKSGVRVKNLSFSQLQRNGFYSVPKYFMSGFGFRVYQYMCKKWK